MAAPLSITSNPFCSSVIEAFDNSVQQRHVFPIPAAKKALAEIAPRAAKGAILGAIDQHQIRQYLFENSNTPNWQVMIKILNEADSFREWMELVENIKQCDETGYFDPAIEESAEAIINKLGWANWPQNLRVQNNLTSNYQILVQRVATYAFRQANDDNKTTLIRNKNNQIDDLAKDLASKTKTLSYKVEKHVRNFFSNTTVQFLLGLALGIYTYHFASLLIGAVKFQALPSILAFLTDNLPAIVIRYATICYHHRLLIWILSYIGYSQSPPNSRLKQFFNIMRYTVSLPLTIAIELFLLPYQIFSIAIFYTSTLFNSSARLIERHLSYKDVVNQTEEEKEIVELFSAIVFDQTKPKITLWHNFCNNVSEVANKALFWRHREATATT